ncbi:hypothetical protein AB1K62_00195 [Parasphingorhabdus sp. JC815]|uniref:hypothetical protein n=1 Tax=Parasphingorhabdus sp. JC815 TaxID=3232140 RepID=UPI003459D5C5
MKKLPMIAAAFGAATLIAAPSFAQDVPEESAAEEAAPVGAPATIDTDGDGKMDAWDQRGDGKPDSWDTNGDGSPDAFDQDGDGAPDPQ